VVVEKKRLNTGTFFNNHYTGGKQWLLYSERNDLIIRVSKALQGLKEGSDETT
jgi:hypothetical protein